MYPTGDVQDPTLVACGCRQSLSLGGEQVAPTSGRMAVSTPAITARRNTRRSIRSTSPTSASLKIAWRRPQVDAEPAARRRPSASSTTSARRRSWSTACSTRRTASASPKRSIRRPARRCGCRSPAPMDGPIAIRGSANRGVAYWGEGADARIITFRNRYLYALNPKTGEPIPTFGNNGVVDLGADVGPRSTGYRWNSRAADRPRRDRHGLGDGRSGFGDEDRRRSRRRARLRRAHRQAALDLPRRADGRRCGGDQDVGRRFVAIHRRRQRLVVDERGR